MAALPPAAQHQKREGEKCFSIVLALECEMAALLSVSRPQEGEELVCLPRNQEYRVPFAPLVDPLFALLLLLVAAVQSPLLLLPIPLLVAVLPLL